MAKLRVDLGSVNSSQQLHDLLASTFGFPDYYGCNWDAFDDCIRDFGPDEYEIVLVNWRQLAQHLPRDATLLHKCLTDFAASRQGVRVVGLTTGCISRPAAFASKPRRAVDCLNVRGITGCI